MIHSEQLCERCEIFSLLASHFGLRYIGLGVHSEQGDHLVSSASVEGLLQDDQSTGCAGSFTLRAFSLTDSEGFFRMTDFESFCNDRMRGICID